MICAARQKALVLDDEQQFTKLLSIMLHLLNWDSEIIASQEEGFLRLQKESFDAVITDYHMPDGNGFHFICCLRRDGINIPAIVMSGDEQVLRLTPKDLLHIPAVLQKPFTISELRGALTMATAVDKGPVSHGPSFS